MQASVEEIQDDDFRARLVEKDEEDWESDEELGTDEDSDDEEYEIKERGLVIPEETVWERISALRDIIPPSTRQSIASRASKWSGYGGAAAVWGGRFAWVVTTTILLWGLPYTLAVEEEMRVQQQERDFASQQQGAQQMLGQPNPAGSVPGQQPQSGAQGIRPPGF